MLTADFDASFVHCVWHIRISREIGIMAHRAAYKTKMKLLLCISPYKMWIFKKPYLFTLGSFKTNF